MNDYYRFVKELSDRNEDYVFLNSDEGKMLSVFKVMFQGANKVFRVFAGSLCNDTTDNKEYIDAVSEFLERGGKLRVLLNNFDEKKAFQSDLFRRLYYYVTKGKEVRIRTTNEKPYITSGDDRINVHFSVGDEKSYRIEQDIEKRTAVCNMNGEEQAKDMARLFDKIFENYYVKEVDLKLLFERG